MMVVADTCAIIWDALQPERLSGRAREILDEADKSGGVIFCDISLWEIAMLISKGRLEIETTYLEFIELVKTSRKFIIHPITAEIADAVVNLPNEINADPADRIIAATSIVTGAPLVTADTNLLAADSVRTVW